MREHRLGPIDPFPLNLRLPAPEKVSMSTVSPFPDRIHFTRLIFLQYLSLLFSFAVYFGGDFFGLDLRYYGLAYLFISQFFFTYRSRGFISHLIEICEGNENKMRQKRTIIAFKTGLILGTAGPLFLFALFASVCVPQYRMSQKIMKMCVSQTLPVMILLVGLSVMPFILELDLPSARPLTTQMNSWLSPPVLAWATVNLHLFQESYKFEKRDLDQILSSFTEKPNLNLYNLYLVSQKLKVLSQDTFNLNPSNSCEVSAAVNSFRESRRKTLSIARRLIKLLDMWEPTSVILSFNFLSFLSIGGSQIALITTASDWLSGLTRFLILVPLNQVLSPKICDSETRLQEIRNLKKQLRSTLLYKLSESEYASYRPWIKTIAAF